MAHDNKNPRTKRYSKIKTALVNVELFLKKSFYFCVVLINFFCHSRNKKYLDIGKYKVNDARFINYLFYSLKENYNFSYDISLDLLNFIKKIGLINFMKYSTPNFFIKKNKKIKFLINHQGSLNENQINFNTNYFSKKNISSNLLYLPYYIYPRSYNKIYPKIGKLKNNIKTIKILFSGSTNFDVYSKFNWADKDGKKWLNRIEIINFVQKHFKEKIFILKKFSDLKNFNSEKTPIIFSVNENLIKKTKTNLTNFQHYNLISKSDFFLTVPGGDMPLCHHFIEAIKLKSIPISQYADLHKPNLDNDCYLKFSDYDSLEHSIHEALNMDSNLIKIKQDKLEEYYNNKISPEIFYKNFEARSSNEIIACNDVESLNWL